jgi:quercetin dioxygenase-like cupin family protein
LNQSKTGQVLPVAALSLSVGHAALMAVIGAEQAYSARGERFERGPSPCRQIARAGSSGPVWLHERPARSRGDPEERALGHIEERPERAESTSRVIACTGGGSVTLFAFDAGEELGEHTTPYDALVVVLEGELRLTVGGAPVRAVSGSVVRLPANVPHAIESPGRSKMMLVMLQGRKT